MLFIYTISIGYVSTNSKHVLYLLWSEISHLSNSFYDLYSQGTPLYHRKSIDYYDDKM